MIDYLLIGHITADLTPAGRTLGGTVSYAARTASAFGLHVGVLTSAAEGEPLLDAFMPHGHGTAIMADETTTYENIYTPHGRVQYVRGCAARITPDMIPDTYRGAPLVHLAPIAGEFEPRELVTAFDGGIVLLTLQGLLRTWGGDGRVRFKRWFDADALRHIDIVVFSEEDIADAPGMEAEFAGAVTHLFVTRAERGGTYYYRGVPKPYDTPQVTVVEPTGAGDVFASALLASLHRTSDMQAAIPVAARLAANAVTRPGLAGTPTHAEVESAFAAAPR